MKDILDNTIIICENRVKRYLLKKWSIDHTFLNVKFYTKKEFFKEYFFKYDEKAISYLMSKYNLKINIILMYLDNLYYIDESKKYSNNKLNFLVNLKKELDENKLLIYNDNFKNSLNGKNIVVFDYPFLEDYEINIFNKYKAKYINNTDNYNVDTIYEFDSIEEEINYVLKSICKLIDSGIDINKIKLLNVSSNYYNELKRLSSFYKLNIDIPTNNTLFNNKITKKFLESNLNIDVIKDDDSNIVNSIINICNKYVEIDDLNIKEELIINDLKNTKISNFKYKNYIEIVDFDYIFGDEYVFMVNFNSGYIPNVLKDEDYITDNIKSEVNLKTTLEKNKLYKEYIKNKIKSIKNLVITYKLKDEEGTIYPSSLISEMNISVKREDNNIFESYSIDYDLIKYSKLKDNYEMYGEYNEDYIIYQNNLGDISYKSYDNSFKGIRKESFKEYLNNKLILSYSSLNNYNKCAFRYYIANILKLDIFEETFETFIGSMFHSVLEKCLNNNLNVEEEVSNFIKDSKKELSVKESCFVNKIIDDIKYVISVINKQKEYTNLDKSMLEKKIFIDKSRDIKVTFMGFVDKILFKENSDNTIVSIIDYKTGFVDIDIKLVPYGLGLQLPIYLYLVKKSNLFTNPKFAGFYLQYILDKDIIRNNKLSYEEQRYDNLKLMGYSNSDVNILKEFDNTYEDSLLIKGLKTKGDGNFYSYSKVLNDSEIDKLIALTEDSIDKSIDSIINADFSINPKKIGYDNPVGCEFCHFKDACFRKDKDFLIYDNIKDLSFLGGDNNAEVD